MFHQYVNVMFPFFHLEWKLQPILEDFPWRKVLTRVGSQKHLRVADQPSSKH